MVPPETPGTISAEPMAKPRMKCKKVWTSMARIEVRLTAPERSLYDAGTRRLWMRTIAWNEMSWLNEPPAAELDGDNLVVSTGRNTDFWHKTAYGFVHDDGHLLGAPFPPEAAIEVTFQAEFEAQFDQAGLMLRGGPDTWLKTGVELSDGQLYASVVNTAGHVRLVRGSPALAGERPRAHLPRQPQG